MVYRSIRNHLSHLSRVFSPNAGTIRHCQLVTTHHALVRYTCVMSDVMAMHGWFTAPLHCPLSYLTEMSMWCDDSRLRSSARGDFTVTTTKRVLSTARSQSSAGKLGIPSRSTSGSLTVSVMTRSVAILRHVYFQLHCLTCNSNSVTVISYVFGF